MRFSPSIRSIVLAAGVLAVASGPALARHDRTGAFVGGLVAGAVAGAVIDSAARPYRPHYYYGGPVYAPAPVYVPAPGYYPPPRPAYCGAPPYPPCPLPY
jgi:hypothetical protein